MRVAASTTVATLLACAHGSAAGDAALRASLDEWTRADDSFAAWAEAEDARIEAMADGPDRQADNARLLTAIGRWEAGAAVLRAAVTALADGDDVDRQAVRAAIVTARAVAREVGVPW